ncbi:ComC/BlpC family leader-containing pheromone/bacteriocin [Sunxiuqinia elliptica]
MKTLFANNENNIFDSFEILTKEELNKVKGGRGRDLDLIVDDLD